MKPFSQKLEESVLKLVYDRRTKGLRVSRKMIIKKAKIMHDEMTKIARRMTQMLISWPVLGGYVTSRNAMVC